MKLYLDMVGCRLNQAEIENLARRSREQDHVIAFSPEESDAFIINTCCVTKKACADSRKMIRHYLKYNKQVYVTGCWVTMFPNEAIEISSKLFLFSNLDKDQIIDRITDQYSPKTKIILERQPISGSRKRTRAFIKVQDGCNFSCTYCLTTIARGRSTSKPLDLIIEDIKSAEMGGCNEVVLSGVQLGSWGNDFLVKKKLSDLISEILSKCKIPRIRISSIEPWNINEELLNLWKDSRLCRHFHIPIQSGSEIILKSMKRNYSLVSLKEYIHKVDNMIKNVAITTDVIVGFPGETIDEFNKTVDVIRELPLSGGHVFSYSPMPFTIALGLPGQIMTKEIKERNKIIREELKHKKALFTKQFIGHYLDVLWETSIEKQSLFINKGLSDNNLRVECISEKRMANYINCVKIKEVSMDNVLIGNG